MERNSVQPTSRLIKAKAAREYLGVSSSAMYALMHCRTFPSIRIGGRYYVYVDKLEEWLDKMTREKKTDVGFPIEERRRA